MAQELAKPGLYGEGRFAFKRELRADGSPVGISIWFFCPGCENAARIPIAPQADGSGWEWNGDYDNPTLSPSILVTTPNSSTPQCHGYLRSGYMEFLGDSTHAHAGKRLRVPELPEWLR